MLLRPREPLPGLLQPRDTVLRLPAVLLLHRRPQRLLPLPLGGAAPLVLPPPVLVALRRPQLGAQRAPLFLREGLEVAEVSRRYTGENEIR